MTEGANFAGYHGSYRVARVQHAPHLSIPMASWLDHLGAESRHEVFAVRSLAPTLPVNLPGRKPNTGLSIAVAARAMQIDPLRTRTLIRSLYRVFWREGSNVSAPAVLPKAALTIGLPVASLLGTEARDDVTTTTKWENDWRDTCHGAVHLPVRTDGQRVVGLPKVEQLKAFIT